MASSVIGALRVNLGLDSALFMRGAQRSQSALSRMRSQFRVVAGVAAVAGAAISAAALAGARDIDLAAKSARRLDSSIGGFRALQLAAGEAGVNLSSLTNDIQTMNREIASIGTSGNGQRALDALGVSLAELEGLDADEKLAIIADRVKALGLSSGETTAVLRDLGVRNREMSLLVLQGGDAIRAARQDVQDYGLAISSVDAARIEQANDQIGRLGLVGQYAGQQLALAFVPAMGAVAQVMTDSLREGGLLRTVLDGITQNMDVLAASAGVAVAAFGVRYVGALAIAKVSTLTLTGALVALRTALITTGIGALVVGAGFLIAKFSDLVGSAGGFGDAMILLGDVAKGVWAGISSSAQAIPAALAGVWQNISAGFLSMVADLTYNWSQFLGYIARGLEGLSGIEINGVQLFEGLAGGVAARVRNAATETAAASNDILDSSFAASEAAAASFATASAAVTEGFSAAADAGARLRDVVTQTADASEGAAEGAEVLADSLEDVAEGGGSAAGGVGAAAEALEEATTFGEGFADAMGKAGKSAADLGRDLGGTVLRGIDSVADAFGDFVSSGFRHFDDVLKAAAQAFRSFISQLVTSAARNRILIGVGIGGTGAGGAAASAVAPSGGGGGVLGLLGQGGSLLGSLGRGGSLLGGAGFAGGTGLLGGLGNAVSGGLSGIFNIGANAAAAGGGLLATLGAAVPIIGGIAAAFSFFRSTTKELDRGIVTTVRGMDVLVQQFRTLEKRRFFGLSKKVRTEISSASAATVDPIKAALADLQGSVASAAAQLGVSKGAFDDFAFSTRISTRGKTQEEAAAAIEAGLTRITDAMADLVPGLDAFRRGGEGSSATLDRLSTSLAAANQWLTNLDLRLFDASVAGAGASAAFVELFGSLDGFTSAAGAYYQGFFTDAERFQRATELMSMELQALGIDALPRTRAAFRALVDEADSLGNRDLTASLIQLAPAFAEITAEANALTASLSDGSFFKTAADAVLASAAPGFRGEVEALAEMDGMGGLLREVVRAIREGDINNARLTDRLYQETRNANLGASL